MKWREFILEHDQDDLGKLALERNRHAGEIASFDEALTTLEVRRKLQHKVPEWWALPSLHFPLRLSGEQCSSSETARYKAQVAREAAGGGCIADLTGGLGVDSWAFARQFGQVLYNEMQPALCAAAQQNFRELGVERIIVKNQLLKADTLACILEGCKPDILFLDPARRAEDGRKVFRLEDCQPDVLQLLPALQKACPLLLLKLSPMADISLVCKQLGCVKAVHVVEAEGECKELLLLLERGYTGPRRLVVYASGAVADIPPEEMPPRLGARLDGWLFEPGKALLKAGAFHWPVSRFSLEKLGRHTHLYTHPHALAALAPFGKWYRILEAVPLGRQSIKELGRRFPQAHVTARNLPLTSDQLRSKLGCRPGGDLHIFGLQLDALEARYLLVCQRELL